MFRELYRIACQTQYLFIALLVTFLVFTVTLFIPNTMLLTFGLSFSEVTMGDHFMFILSFYNSLFTNFTPIGAVFTVVTSVLFGVNVALLIYYVRLMQSNDGVKVIGVMSLGGLVSGFLGVGCAACGSVIITSLLSLIGAGGLLSLLPFRGQEFTFIAIILLTYSLVTLTARIKAGKVCHIV